MQAGRWSDPKNYMHVICLTPSVASELATIKEEEMRKLKVRTHNNRLSIGDVTLTFQRTLRIPDDGATYPLPPGLGQFPIRHVDDCTDRVPDRWREHGGVFIPMYQREALWLSFHSNRPVVLPQQPSRCTQGGDRQGGRSHRQAGSERLTKRPQNYLVCPDPQLTP